MNRRQRREQQRKQQPATSTPRATHDSFNNFLTKTGIQANPLTRGIYTQDMVSHNRQELSNMYSSSWMVAKAVDTPSEDMTREGIEITTAIEQDQVEAIDQEFDRLQLWDKICYAIKMSRLFGGSIAVMLLDGADMSTPLRIETIGEGQFKGLLVLDRWQVMPQLTDLVTDLGPDLGKPKYYDTLTEPYIPLRGTRIHYSRVIRLEGQSTDYLRSLSEQLWGVSIVERMFDRIQAFDSTTQGAAMLAHRAHLRTAKISGLRRAINMLKRSMASRRC